MHSLAFTLEDFQLNEIIHYLRNHIMKIMPNYIKNKISISLKSEFFSGYLLTSEQNLEYLKYAIKPENAFIMALHRSSTYLLNSCLFVYFIVCVSTMMNVIIDTIIYKYIIYYVRKE